MGRGKAWGLTGVSRPYYPSPLLYHHHLPVYTNITLTNLHHPVSPSITLHRPVSHCTLQRQTEKQTSRDRKAELEDPSHTSPFLQRASSGSLVNFVVTRVCSANSTSETLWWPSSILVYKKQCITGTVTEIDHGKWGQCKSTRKYSLDINREIQKND